MATQEAWQEITRIFSGSLNPPGEHKIGLEIERIGMWPDGMALHYESQKDAQGKERPGAGELFREIEKRHGWKPIPGERGLPIGFDSPYGKVSLEPGSQLELSLDPQPSLQAIADMVHRFESLIDEITAPWGLLWLGIGVNPVHKAEEIDLIPSHRYAIMTDYLGKRGKLGTSMMRLSSSVQVNLDYTSETEGIEMLRVALAVTPVAYALFNNSPFFHGQPADVLSYRNTIWRDTDPDRTGLLPEVFADGFDFSRYAELVWKRPLMFAQTRKKNYAEAKGESLETISEKALACVTPDAANLMNGIRELFTEVRLKPGYIEIRSIDGQRPSMRYAAAAFWSGLMYDADARRLAWKLLGGLSTADREKLWVLASRDGLRAKMNGIDLQAISKELVAAARQTLVARGRNGEQFLEPVLENVQEGICPADTLLRQFYGSWKRDFRHVIEYCGEARG